MELKIRVKTFRIHNGKIISLIRLIKDYRDCVESRIKVYKYSYKLKTLKAHTYTIISLYKYDIETLISSINNFTIKFWEFYKTIQSFQII